MRVYKAAARPGPSICARLATGGGVPYTSTCRLLPHMHGHSFHYLPGPISFVCIPALAAAPQGLAPRIPLETKLLPGPALAGASAPAWWRGAPPRAAGSCELPLSSRNPQTQTRRGAAAGVQMLPPRFFGALDCIIRLALGRCLFRALCWPRRHSVAPGLTSTSVVDPLAQNVTCSATACSHNRHRSCPLPRFSSQHTGERGLPPLASTDQPTPIHLIWRRAHT